MFDVDARTILYVRHGSHAYGLNVQSSDEDYKGVCIPPKEYMLGFMKKFEQSEMMASKGGGVDSVVYALNKFVRLAVDCNPTIVEVLFVDDEHIVKRDIFGDRLRSIRNMFISKKARFTFSGYAYQQLKRIKTHRKWLLDPPKQPPTRTAFGLSEEMKLSQSELGAFDAMSDTDVMPALSSDIVSLYAREKQYANIKSQWDQYVNWKKARNPARAELEERFGCDTKHAMHLCRLMRMCKEILSFGTVIVKRPDRDELLAIRSGEWSYERIVEHAERLDDECKSLYETSSLKRCCDVEAIDGIVVELTEKYLSFHG